MPVISCILIVKRCEHKSAKHTIKLGVREKGGSEYKNMMFIALYSKQDLDSRPPCNTQAYNECRRH